MPGAEERTSLMGQPTPSKTWSLTYIACSAGWCCCFSAILGPLLAIFLCRYNYSPGLSQSAFIQQKDGQDFLAWFNLRPEQQSFAQIRKPLKLANETWEILSNYTPNISKTVATFSAKDAMHAMYEATKVEGVFEHVPEPLRGVFWMRGNAVPEELAVLQFGQWFPEERVYLTSVGPYNWAWAWGTPPGSPAGGALYNEEFTLKAMTLMTDGATCLSFKFETCPASAEYCEAGAGDFSYAHMQAHVILNNFSVHANFADTANIFLPEPLRIVTAEFTLEKLSKETGAKFKRTCYWGVGACKWFEFGSYDLTKVIDGDGKPFEPHYTEFLEYMGEVPIMMMTGINATSQEQLDEAKVYLRDQVDSLHDSFDERTLNV